MPELEEDFGLAKRSMSILERATQLVNDEDKFEMFTIYIAKGIANYGRPATRPISERALKGGGAVLPDLQTAEMCLRFAALERKLGEIDRALPNSAIRASTPVLERVEYVRNRDRFRRRVQADVADQPERAGIVQYRGELP